MNRLSRRLASSGLPHTWSFWAPTPVFLAGALPSARFVIWEYSGLVVAHGIAKPGPLGWLTGLLIIFFPQFILPGASILLISSFSCVAFGQSARCALQVAGSFMGVFYTFAPWRLRH